MTSFFFLLLLSPFTVSCPMFDKFSIARLFFVNVSTFTFSF